MAISTTNLQTLARHYANDRELVITSGNGLTIANVIYGSLFDSRQYRFPEATQINTSITTVVGQEAYTWPTSPVFVDEPFIDWQWSTNYWVPIRAAKDEEEWSRYDTGHNGTPTIYRKVWDGTEVDIRLREPPDRAATLRITGMVEPTALSASQNTIFRTNDQDRALAMLIAADYHLKWGNATRAGQLDMQARGLLAPYSFSPVRVKGTYRPHGIM